MKEYKVTSNQALNREVLEYELNNVASEGWRPILLSTTQADPRVPISVTVVFEREKGGPVAPPE